MPGVVFGDAVRLGDLVGDHGNGIWFGHRSRAFGREARRSRAPARRIRPENDSRWRSGASMRLMDPCPRAPIPSVPQVAVHRVRQAWTSAQPVPRRRGNGSTYRMSAAILTAIRSADSLTEVARKMRVARGRFDPAMTEKPADDRQDLAERQCPRGKAVSDVMDAHVAGPGPRADGLPRPVDVGHVCARLVSRNDPGIAGLARPGLEDADRRRRQVDRAGASFPVGEVNLGRVEIDMLPAQGQDFVSAAADDGRRRCGRGTIGGGHEARPAEWTPGRSGISERGRQKAGGGVAP